VKWGGRLENRDDHRHDVLMQQEHREPMDASKQFCPNLACSARGQIGTGTIRIHDRKRQRYRCRTCGQTFSARHGTMLEGLRKPSEVIIIVVTLLAYGCPIQAIVHAFGLDERTVAAWRDRAGKHCAQVHHAVVEVGHLNLLHVQADEIRVKGRAMIAWMGLALMVSTRLWLGGVVSLRRETALAEQLMQQVRSCSQAACALLVATDGWNAYPKAIMRAFRDKVKQTPGRGRACLQVWSQLMIATVIKRSEKKRVVEVIRQMTLGALGQATQLLEASRGGITLNTAFIERFNGTMRERLATLTRKCRHAASRIGALEAGMYLIGCTYNLCFPHQGLSSTRHAGCPCTPAMAAGLTNHVWSISELLRYKVAPSPWIAPKRRGRSPKQPVPKPGTLRGPRLRLRKGVLCSLTS
jgi:transposase-like protein/IS1 family transposase